MPEGTKFSECRSEVPYFCCPGCKQKLKKSLTIAMERRMLNSVWLDFGLTMGFVVCSPSCYSSTVDPKLVQWSPY